MYVKLFSSILTSSVWAEEPSTRIVWIALLALADREGFVRSSPSGLARLANVPVDACQAALGKFESPDAESSSPEDEGRRIRRIDGGWFVINYEHYRQLADEETRKAQWRTDSKNYRERQKAKRPARQEASANHQGASVSTQVVSAHTEAEAQAEAEGEAVRGDSRTADGELSKGKRGRAKRLPSPPADSRAANDPPVAGATGTTRPTAPTTPPAVPAGSPTVLRFVGRFYGGASATRRQDVARQMTAALTTQGVLYQGAVIRAVDAAHLDEVCQAILEEPPRDDNAAMVWVLTQLQETASEVRSARMKALERSGGAAARPRAAAPTAIGGIVTALTDTPTTEITTDDR